MEPNTDAQSEADHPRIRGEHDSLSTEKFRARGSSPHTRGAQPTARPERGLHGIIPAYAGSTVAEIPGKIVKADHPRIRGEHTLVVSRLHLMPGSSPHTRGAPSEAYGTASNPADHPRIRGEHPGIPSHKWGSFRIIPAYAGSTPWFIDSRGWLADHPRIRGEHVAQIPGKVVKAGSSPHTRGARRSRGLRRHRGRIIPAYAGSTPAGAGLRPAPGDHPRIRGEHSRNWDSPRASVGSSPHTRGARGRARGYPISSRIIPAYAGSTRAGRSRPPRFEDHPRIRGEHSPTVSGTTPKAGSSPHTRGARLPLGAPAWAAGIIPAYAGSTTLSLIQKQSAEDHPRIRGEHVTASRNTRRGSGSSPHTRGAPDCATSARRPSRIIPAYAGSTRAIGVVQDRRHGSSPHTRGAPSRLRGLLSGWRIIPAYAGSTSTAGTIASRRSDHPRIRGEHGEAVVKGSAHAGSSPHTRGALTK